MGDEERPTYDRNAEVSTLAACMATRTARDEARRYVSGRDFYDPAHELLWNTMGDLDRAEAGVDPAALLSKVQGKGQLKAAAARLLPDLITWPALPDHVGTYAETVREWATRRRLITEATRTTQQALDTSEPATSLAATVANRFASIRDTGNPDDVESLTLGEVLSQPEDEPDWLVPGLLERRDRFMLTGEEGLGKSHLLRQMAILPAAGLDPFGLDRIDPVSVLIVDCENSVRQVRRRVRGLVENARRWGSGDPDRVNLLCSSRIDITADRDLARIHRELDACQPDLVVIGPLYRLVPRALQTDDDTAPMLAALDTIRDRGAALLMEAHAGHAVGKQGQRDLRPRGSSSLLGWPEFGYGLRGVASKYAALTKWRGDRDQRAWPTQLRHADDGTRWVPHDLPEPWEAA